MGEYWAPVNMTKREKYDEYGSCKTRGAMTPEFIGAIVILILSKRWSETDEIRLLSDYGGESKLNPETYEVVEQNSGPGIDQDEWYSLTDVQLVPKERGENRDSQPPDDPSAHFAYIGAKPKEIE